VKQKQYSESFKQRMMQRMVGPGRVSASALSAEVGVGQPTLSRWLRAAGRVSAVSDDEEPKPKAKRPEEWTPQQKLGAVMDAAGIVGHGAGRLASSQGPDGGTPAAVARGARGASLGGLRTARASSEHGESPARTGARTRAEEEGQGAGGNGGFAGAAGKSAGLVGGRGRAHEAEQRRALLAGIAEAEEAGAPLSRCAEVAGISERTVQRWRRESDGGEDRRRGPNTVPGNKLSEHEERRLLRVLTSPEYRDLSPRQVIPALAKQGTYIASEATAYRVLHKHDMQKHRTNTRPRTSKKPDELTATSPNQAYCWDITYLKRTCSGPSSTCTS
jgi:transposase-like protein